MDDKCCAELQACDVGTPCGDMQACVEANCGTLTLEACTAIAGPCEGVNTNPAVTAWNNRAACYNTGACGSTCVPTCASDIYMNDQGCDDCARNSCCAELQACNNGTACGDVITCLNTYNCTTEDCLTTNCPTAWANGRAGYDALNGCLETGCPTECPGG
jgi:hypothetical protein